MEENGEIVLVHDQRVGLLSEKEAVSLVRDISLQDSLGFGTGIIASFLYLDFSSQVDQRINWCHTGHPYLAQQMLSPLNCCFDSLLPFFSPCC